MAATATELDQLDVTNMKVGYESMRCPDLSQTNTRMSRIANTVRSMTADNIRATFTTGLHAASVEPLATHELEPAFSLVCTAHRAQSCAALAL